MTLISRFGLACRQNRAAALFVGICLALVLVSASPCLAQPAKAPAKAKAQATTKAQAGRSITSEVAPKSAWETMTEDPDPPMPGLVGQAPPPAAPPAMNLPVMPDTRSPADAVPAPRAPTQGDPRSDKRQSLGVRANIITKGSTKVTGVVTPVETPGQSNSGGTGAGVILRHEF